jgi:hypothetical protein
VNTQHTESAGIIPGNAFVPNTSRANKYAIHWTSTVSGTAGTGTKRFKQTEAEQLAAELNRDYPDTEHEAVLFVPPPAEVTAVPA